MFNLKKRTFWKPFLGILFLSIFTPRTLYAATVSLQKDSDGVIIGATLRNAGSANWACSPYNDGRSLISLDGYASTNFRGYNGQITFGWGHVYASSVPIHADWQGVTGCFAREKLVGQILGYGTSYSLSVNVTKIEPGRPENTRGRLLFDVFTGSYDGALSPTPPPAPVHNCKASNIDINFGSFTPGESNTTIEKNLSISCNYTANITLSTPADTINFSNAGDSGFRAVVAPAAGSFPLQVKANQSVSVPLKAMLKANCPDLLCVPQQAYSGSTSLIIAFD